MGVPAAQLLRLLVHKLHKIAVRRIACRIPGEFLFPAALCAAVLRGVPAFRHQGHFRFPRRFPLGRCLGIVCLRLPAARVAFPALLGHLGILRLSLLFGRDKPLSMKGIHIFRQG